MAKAVDKAFFQVAQSLKQLDVKFALIGGLASNLWVRSDCVRETNDVDFGVMAMYPDPAREVHVWLVRHKIADVEATVPSVSKTAEFRTLFVRGVQVDFVLIKNQKYVSSAFRRAGSVNIGSFRIRILAPEDVFLYKSIAGREKDIQPMQALAQRADFNRRYVERWSRRLKSWAFAKRVVRG